jgi:transcription initiation factor TFIID subunit 5
MHIVNISCSCLSCEGAMLASGSADCTVKLWDVTSSTKALKTEDT